MSHTTNTSLDLYLYLSIPKGLFRMTKTSVTKTAVRVYLLAAVFILCVSGLNNEEFNSQHGFQSVVDAGHDNNNNNIMEHSSMEHNIVEVKDTKKASALDNIIPSKLSQELKQGILNGWNKFIGRDRYKLQKRADGNNSNSSNDNKSNSNGNMSGNSQSQNSADQKSKSDSNNSNSNSKSDNNNSNSKSDNSNSKSDSNNSNSKSDNNNNSKSGSNNSKSGSGSLLEVSASQSSESLLEIGGKTTKSSGDSKNSASATGSSDAKSTDGSQKSDNNKSNSKSDSKPSKSTSSYDYDITTSIDPRLPAGGVTMMTPNPTLTTYIKIGDQATFSWSYTSLSVTPRYVNFLAYCSHNSMTYTITTNHPSMETQMVWDTKEFQANATIPLLTAEYKLFMFDSKLNTTSVASAGYLSVYSQTFAMYTPQPYTPLSEWTCYNCKPNGGILGRFVDPLVAKFLLAMVIIFVGSTIQTITL